MPRRVRRRYGRCVEIAEEASMDEFPMNSPNCQAIREHFVAAADRLDVSVIVPTFNRASSLSRLLHDLIRQTTRRRYEVIVVDNGSADETAATVLALCATTPLVHYLHESRRGASNARNRGIAAAAAPVLAFVDDDVRVANDWIESVARSFERDPTVDCIGGRVEPHWPCQPPAWLTSAHWAPLALQIARGSAPYLDRDHASACLITANFACRAEVFRLLGGFSPAFLRDEDREFNLRMWRAGKRGRFDPTVVAFADIQPERLEKRHHRRWYRVTGRSHGRLRYREIIDRDGRLSELDETQRHYVLGAPGYLYRELAGHSVRWVCRIAVARTDDAFFEECRVRYLLAYLSTRWAAYAEHLGTRARGFASRISGITQQTAR